MIEWLQTMFGGVAGFLSIACAWPYYRSIMAGQTKPHLFTWIVWSVLGIVSAVIQASEHAGFATIFASSVNAAVCVLFATLSVLYGTKNITRSDWGAFIAALSAIPLWALTHDPLPSAILISLIDAAGIYPTLRKAYHEPETESAISFTMSAFAWWFSVAAIIHFSLASVLYPLTAGMLDTVLVVMILVRRRSQAKRTHFE